MSNSGLVVYTKLSPNHSGQRTHSIDRITPPIVWWDSFLVNQFADASQARSGKQAATMVLVWTGEFLLV